MKYQKELIALREYIANFNPDEFTSSADFSVSPRPTPEQLADLHRLKAKLKRKRQLAESVSSFLDTEANYAEVIITQDEIDALLEGWTAPSG